MFFKINNNYFIPWRFAMNRTYRVGVVGATGMVGQRFLAILKQHPWFKVTVLAASQSSAGKTYAEAVEGRLKADDCDEILKCYGNFVILDAVADLKKIVSSVDFVFCAVNMERNLVKELEEAYAKNECPVVSNNSANRLVDDVPMVIPEINSEHLNVIEFQKKRLKTKKGFIAVKSNCSIQSYVPAIAPLLKFEPTKIGVVTCQAISGAGRTFENWPDIIDNVVPFIKGEEEKSELEPLKIFGELKDGKIKLAENLKISAQCFRVPVSDGHMAAVQVSFKKKPSIEEIKLHWKNFKTKPQALKLPSAPKWFLHYFSQSDRPQTRLDRNLESGMAISLGRLRSDPLFDYKFVCLSHNTVRGAAGGAVLMAELLAAEGYFNH